MLCEAALEALIEWGTIFLLWCESPAWISGNNVVLLATVRCALVPLSPPRCLAFTSRVGRSGQGYLFLLSYGLGYVQPLAAVRAQASKREGGV